MTTTDPRRPYPTGCFPALTAGPVNHPAGIDPRQKSSSSGNRTPGVCVTGRNVTNYTNEDGWLEAHRPAASGSTPEHPTEPGIDPRDAPIPGSTPDQPKSDTFSIFACHPCAGAMLIFSVSFQFLRMMPKHSTISNCGTRYSGLEATRVHYGGFDSASKYCSVAPRSITERGIG